MYEILMDGELLYSPSMIKEGYGVLEPKLTLAVNRAGSLTFSILEDNACYSKLKKLKSIVTVLQDGKQIFRGRILHDETDFYKRKTVYCEGELSFLLDSIQRPYSFCGDVTELFRQLIEEHNRQVEPEKRFEVGRVTVTDSNNCISRYTTLYKNTMENLEEKLLDTHGGRLSIRTENGRRYLDYLAEQDVCQQTIEFGKNLLDMEEFLTAEELYTVLIPLGAKDEQGNRLTISSVNGGEDYIESQTGIAQFGRIVRIEEWDDVTVPENLLRKARERLTQNVEMNLTISIKAISMRLLGIDAEEIMPGQRIRAISAPHSMDAYFEVSQVVMDLQSPENTEYTLGAAVRGLTDKQIGARKAAEASNEAAVGRSAEAIRTAEDAAAKAENAAANASDAMAEAQRVAQEVRTLPEVPKVVSAFQNDVGYLTDKNLESVLDRIEKIEDRLGPEIITSVQVTGVKAVYKDGRIILIWDDVRAERYKVTRMVNETLYKALTYSAPKSGWEDSDVSAGNTYRYCISGYFLNSDGGLTEGDVSEVVMITI